MQRWIRYGGALLVVVTAGTVGADEAVVRLEGRVQQKFLFGKTEEVSPALHSSVWLTREETGDKQVYAAHGGRFVFPDVKPGSYVLEARSEGFRTARRRVEVAGDGARVVRVDDLVLMPGVDVEAVLEKLTVDDYDALIFQVSAQRDLSFHLEIELGDEGARFHVAANLLDLGDVSLEKRLPAAEETELRELLRAADPLRANHRGSYFRLRDAPHETLEVLAAGMTAVIVVSGNPDFETGTGRELIEFLYRLPETFIHSSASEQP